MAGHVVDVQLAGEVVSELLVDLLVVPVRQDDDGIPALRGPRADAAAGRRVDGGAGRRAAAQVAGPSAAPLAPRDRQRGIRYDIPILQAEFARTEVFDRPAQGRVFFEEVLRDNLDMGRPKHVQLIFDRRVHRRTPSRYRTRVITDGVISSLHVDYKRSRIKQVPQGRTARCAPRRWSTTRTISMSAAG